MSQIRNRKQVVREREPLLFHSDASRSSSSGSPPPSYSSINTHAAASVQYPTGREDFFRNLFSRLQELFSDIFKTLAFWKEEDLVRDDPEIQEMLASLKAHITCPFDSNSEHKEELDAFWTLHFGEPVPPVPSPEWRRLGFQSDNPLSDFRGPTSRFQLQCLLAYRPPLRPSETLPFVLAGMAICNLLLEFLGLGMLPRAVPSARSALCRLLFRPTQKPKQTALVQALQNEDLSSPESRLRALVVLVLRGLEDRWAAANAGYMDFPAQLKTTADLFTADLAALY